MQKFESVDQGRKFDWSKASRDYGTHRPGPPKSFYEKLAALGVGLKGQEILDLGTGTGLVAREFARRGCVVSGIDLSKGQIAMARELAEREALAVDLRVAPAEKLPFPDHAFDIVIASQCWFYFDKDKVLPEVRRVLKKGGRLVTCHFSYLPRLDEVARETERLILKYNPEWTAADLAQEIPACPEWAEDALIVRAMFYYDEAVVFTREGWRGRIRACRAVAAELAEDEVRRFDGEHAAMLERMTTPEFSVLHRIDAHILEFRRPL